MSEKLHEKRRQELLSQGDEDGIKGVLFDIYRNKDIYYLQTTNISADSIDFGNNLKPSPFANIGYPNRQKFFRSDYNENIHQHWWARLVVEQYHEAQYWVKAIFHDMPRIKTHYLDLLNEQMDIWMMGHGMYRRHLEEN